VRVRSNPTRAREGGDVVRGLSVQIVALGGGLQASGFWGSQRL
jgi:hypothetical protein